MTKKLEAIIALGKNWEVKGNSHKLSISSKLVASAAAEMYLNGSTNKIILSGGYTSNHHKSESSGMKEYIRRKYSIPEQAIILEERSLNTFGNAIETRKIVESHEINDVGILTVSYHLPRTSKIFSKYFENPKFYSAENILIEFPKYEELLQIERDSKFVKLDKLHEYISLSLLYIDKNGKLSNFTSKLLRGKRAKHN